MRGHVTWVIRQDQYVLVELRRGGTVDGQLMYPGGGINAGESALVAFLRETDEELGVCPTTYRALEHEPITTNAGNPITTYVVDKWLGKVPIRNYDDGAYLFWVPAEALSNHPFESMRVITKAVMELQ
jgi:8-oxo-dGTP pyrophosphatase MutT (NUDIX family)